MAFVHLNVKSKASMLHGSSDLSELIKKAEELGQDSVALTDYSNVFNSIQFYREAEKANIKPILGVDVKFCPDLTEAKEQKLRHSTHLTLLAENQAGWQHINRIISESYRPENFFYSPRVDFALLEKYKEGVIVLTGSSFDGTISSCLHDRRDEFGNVSTKATIFKAEALVRKLQKIFDSEHLYLEVQDNGHDDQQVINERLRSIGKKYGLKTVATNNVHYVDSADAESHSTLLSMNKNKFLRATNTPFCEEEYYLKSEDDMLELDITQEEIDLTEEIASRCNVYIDLDQHRLPSYRFVPDGTNAKDYLSSLVQEGFQKLGLNGQDYKDRIDRELKDINDMGFADYFLIVNDVIGWCHKNKILVGSGRGSVGGSLVAYCLRITDIDPLRYGLIWERFLNKGRGGLPDVDSDVPRSKRKEVLNYIKERFGHENVAQICNLNGLQAKAILKEVFNVYGMDFEEANKITALIPAKNEEHVDIHLPEALEKVPELREYEKKYKPWFSIAKSLEGCYKTTGIHAAGIVISDLPFSQSPYPLIKSKDGDMIFGLDMNSVDALHLLKLDILGLSTLDDIQSTIDLVKKRRGITIDRSKIPLDDKKTYDMLGQGFTIGVFQLEKQLGKIWSKGLKPTNIEELADVISIIRPGPLDTGMGDNYKKSKIDGEESLYLHESLRDILKNTHGSLLYQEQVIEICKKLAGMSLVDADKVRKAMGKKKPEEMRKWKQVFVDGCQANLIDPNIGEQIWEYIEKFAGYGFNKSHAVGYALMAYEIAYLKANYTIELLCAKLENSNGDFEKVKNYIYDAKLFGIEVQPPNASVGNNSFEIVDDKTIVFGLRTLKGVGVAAIKDLAKVIENSNNFDEFIWTLSNTKTKINSGVVTALIKGGAFDYIGEQRVALLSKYELLNALSDKELEYVQAFNNGQDWVTNLRTLSDESLSISLKEKNGMKIPSTPRREKLRQALVDYDSTEIFDSKSEKCQWEQFYLGISITGSESDMFTAKNKCVELYKHGYKNMKFDIAVCLDEVRKIFTKTKGEPMAFVHCHDNTYGLDSVVVFPDQFAKYERLLEKDNVVRLLGYINDRSSYVVNKIERLR